MQGCATKPIPPIEVPQAFRLSCERPDGVDDVKTVADLAGYSIRQDGALKVCEAKRKGLVSILDAELNTPKRGWWPWFEGAGK